jgi:hypothetical protein
MHQTLQHFIRQQHPSWMPVRLNDPVQLSRLPRSAHNDQGLRTMFGAIVGRGPQKQPLDSPLVVAAQQADRLRRSQCLTHASVGHTAGGRLQYA